MYEKGEVSEFLSFIIFQAYRQHFLQLQQVTSAFLFLRLNKITVGRNCTAW
jgi:hypothetical protein